VISYVGKQLKYMNAFWAPGRSRVFLARLFYAVLVVRLLAPGARDDAEVQAVDELLLDEGPDGPEEPPSSRRWPGHPPPMDAGVWPLGL